MLLIPSFKNIINDEIVSLPEAKYYHIPMQAYRGELTPIVQKGEYVRKYQLLAESESFFASKIHSPISGTVIDIVKIEDQDYIKIENDFKEYQLELNSLNQIGTNLNFESLTSSDFSKINIENFAKLLNEKGIEGAGGSRFPTSLKYKNLSDPIQYLIINGAECEPYLTTDRVLMSNYSNELIQMAYVLKKIIKADVVYFVIEKHNKYLYRKLSDIANTLDINIAVKIVDNSYPQGAELQLIKHVTGKELPNGSIPSKSRIIVNNVATLFAMYKAVFENKPMTERIVTISGDTRYRKGNYWIAIGTPIGHILEATKNMDALENNNLILGGPMMGKKIESLLTSINKGSGGLLIMKQRAYLASNCIKCGICVDVCPQRLMPLEFVRYNVADNREKLDEYGIMACIECGACDYVCPSNVPLIENILEAKKNNNKHGK